MSVPLEWSPDNWQDIWCTTEVGGWKANADLQAFVMSGRATNWRGGVVSRNAVAFRGDQEVEIRYEYTSSCKMRLYLSLMRGDESVVSVTDTLPPNSGWGVRIHRIKYDGEAIVRFGASPDISFSERGSCGIRKMSVSLLSPDIEAEEVVSPLLPVVASGVPMEVKAQFLNRSTLEIPGGIVMAYSVNGAEPVKESFHDGIKALSSFVYKFDKKFVPATSGEYTLKIWSEYSDDMLNDNDTLTCQFRSQVADVFPLQDRFADGIGRWSVLDTDGDGVVWDYSNDNNNGMVVHPYSSGAGGDLLVSHPVDMPAGMSRVSFYYASMYGTGNLSLRLLGGSSPDVSEMRELVRLPSVTNRGWLNAYVPLEVEEPSVWYFVVEIIGSYDGMLIDNVFIDRGEDLCMKEVVFDTESGFNKSKSNVSLSFSNHGVSPQKDVRVAYYLNDREHFVEETVGNTVLPGETYTHIFSMPADISLPDSTYTLYGEILTKVGEDYVNDLIKGQSISHWANRTVPYVNTFEDGIDGWTFAYGEGTTGKWIHYWWGNWNAYDGDYVLGHAKTGDTSDSWAFSECIEIPEGDYDISFFYRTELNWDKEEYQQSIELRMGEDPSVEGMTDVLATLDDFTVGRPAWKKYIARVHFDHTGKYYFGFHNYKSAGSTSLYIDRFSVVPVASPEPLPWLMDIDSWKTDMTNYNTGSKFVSWSLSEVDGEKILGVEYDEDASYSKVPEGLLATRALEVKAGRDIEVEVEYDCKSDYEPLRFCVYASDVDDPDRYDLVAELPCTEGFEKRTVTIPAPETDGEIFIGVRSNQPMVLPDEPQGVYLLKLKSLSVSQLEGAMVSVDDVDANSEGSIEMDVFSDCVTVSGVCPGCEVTVCSLSAGIVFSGKADENGMIEIVVNGLIPGVYIVRAATQSLKLVI